MTAVTLTGAYVREVRDRHRLSRNQFARLCGFPTQTRLVNIETKDSWKEGNREAVWQVIQELDNGADQPDATVAPAVSPTADPDVASDDGEVTAHLWLPGDLEVYATIDTSEPTGTAALLADLPPVDKILSNGELVDAARCPRKWWLTWYRSLGLRQDDRVGPRATGDRVHRALAMWYVPEGETRVDPRDALERVIVEDWTLLLAALQASVSDEAEREAVVATAAGKFADATALERIMVEGFLEWAAETGADAGLVTVGSEQVLHADLDVPMDMSPAAQLAAEGSPYAAPVPVNTRRIRLVGRLDTRFIRESDGARLLNDWKALAHGTPVLTPTGWRSVESLQVGDTVVAGTGQPTAVTGVYPQGEVELYRVSFSDKTTVDCCTDHLWQVTRYSGREAVLSTRELATDLHNSNGQNRWRVPVIAVSLNETATHAIHPYVLGVLLGDGCRRTTLFGSADQEIVDLVQKCLVGTDLGIRHDGGIGYTIVGPERTKPNLLRRELKRLGLWDCHSYEKSIPTEYLWSAREHRLALLRGLMDTDGSVQTAGRQIIFGTTAPGLRDGVAFLVRSLGGIATVTSHGPGSYTLDGVRHVCRDVYSVSIKPPDGVNPFALARKADVVDSRPRRHPYRYIKGIDPIGRGLATCISVADSSQLYVTKDLVVTHNTVQDLTTPRKTLHGNHQMLTYLLLEWLNTAEGEAHCDGALYTMLRKVKRTARANPPFYDRVEVRHSEVELESHKRQMLARARTILSWEDALRAGANHLDVVPRSWREDCSWSCDFFPVCGMFEDGSRAEDALTGIYQVADPRARYDRVVGATPRDMIQSETTEG